MSQCEFPVFISAGLLCAGTGGNPHPRPALRRLQRAPHPPRGARPAPIPTPAPLKGPARRAANRTWEPPTTFQCELHVIVSGVRHNLFCNKTKWVQNQIFKVSTSKANEWLKLSLIIDPSTCGSKVRPKLNNYFPEIIFD